MPKFIVTTTYEFEIDAEHWEGAEAQVDMAITHIVSHPQTGETVHPETVSYEYIGNEKVAE